MKSSLWETRKGVSVVGVVLVVLLLAGLGVGGFFGYTRYLAPMMDPYAAFLPEGLKNIVPGANAEGFLVYKKDVELSENFKKLPVEMMMANSVESAALVFAKDEASVLAYVEFSSVNEAEMAKKLLSDLARQNKSEGGTYENRENILIVTNNGKTNVFTGLLKDNPGLSRIDKNRFSDQVVAYFDLRDLAGLSSTLPSVGGGMLPVSLGLADGQGGDFPPVAHAQSGFLSANDNVSSTSIAPAGGNAMPSAALGGFLKEMVLYLRLKEGQLSLNVAVNILPKTDLASGVFQDATGGKLSADNVVKTYEESLESLRASIPDLNRMTGLVKMVVPSMEMKISLDDLTFKVDVQSPLQDLVDLVVKEDLINKMAEGPSKAQDAAKKADVNNILVAVEQHNAYMGVYPPVSSCLEDMKELSEYFKNNTIPVDNKGAQIFGDLECVSGYYYQWIPGRGYVIWAKMILEEDGNMTLSPAQYLKNVEQGLATPKVDDGLYYAIGDGLFAREPSIPDSQSSALQNSVVEPPISPVQTSKPKVKVQKN